VPAPNQDFIALAAGDYHSLGLKTDGSIVAWGYDDEGQCSVPAPNADFIALAAGGHHSLGLKADGSIVAWGSNGSSQCTVPAPNADFIALGAGEFHSLAIRSAVTPVDLLFFTASRRGRDVVLRWQEGAARAAGGYQVHRGASKQERRRIAELPPEASGLYEYIDVSPPAGEVSYWIREVAATGPADWYGPVTVEASQPVLPPTVLRVYPNPTSGRSTIGFSLEATADVRLAIFDASGRQVLDVLHGLLEAGPHAAFWNGRDAAGRSVGAGSYFARLEVGGEKRETKILIAR
jgi:hypothetical protein